MLKERTRPLEKPGVMLFRAELVKAKYPPLEEDKTRVKSIMLRNNCMKSVKHATNLFLLSQFCSYFLRGDLAKGGMLCV
jgi:hypothetical protein